jgi:hypothetical protein
MGSRHTFWRRRSPLLFGAVAACVMLAYGPEAGNADAGEAAAVPAAVQETCRMLAPPAGFPRSLAESSGAAWSRRTEGIWWSVNDSGNPAHLFALNARGERVGQVRVRRAENVDWEDLAAGPCPGGGACLFVADVGDNAGRRRHVDVYRVPEPDPGDSQTERAERFRARYPDRPHDAEAFFVLPDGRGYVVTKGTDGPVTLFRFPFRTNGTGEMQAVRVLDAAPVLGTFVTGAGASPDGRWVALRTYTSLHLYRTIDLLGSGGPAHTMSLLPLREPQGEAVALASDGAVLLTSERRGSRGPLFTRFACTLR